MDAQKTSARGENLTLFSDYLAQRTRGVFAWRNVWQISDGALEGREVAGRFQTDSAPVVRIGRAPDNDLVLDAPGVSRYHAALDYTGGAQPALTDLNNSAEDEIAAAYRRRVWLDLVALGGFNVLFLSLTMWALKRKDVL